MQVLVAGKTVRDPRYIVAAVAVAFRQPHGLSAPGAL
jgi:hypothetical protein